MRWGMTRSAGKVRFRSHIAAIGTACLLNLSGAVCADVSATQQNFVDGRVTRDGIDLFYRVVGPTSGDYVLVLSGGPGEDIHSMQGVAGELGKKYRCIMWEQRGTGRSKLPRYDSSTINLNAYGLRRHLSRRSPRSCHDWFGSDHVGISQCVFRQSDCKTRCMRTRSSRLLE